jgi:hypothetical protein
VKTVIISIFSLLLVCGFATVPNKEDASMNETIVSSEISRYDVILLMEIRRATPQAWRPDPANDLNEQRRVHLTLHLVERFKGAELAKPRQSFEIDVTQRRPISGRIANDYGPWSNCDFDGNPQILVFCNPPAPDAALEKTIAQGCEILVQEPDPAYPFAVENVRKATLLLQREDFPREFKSVELQNTIINQRQQLGPLMARFLIEQMESLVPPETSLLFRLLEAPDTTALFRHVVLAHLVEELSLAEDPQVDRRIRLVRTMAAILKEPSATARVLQESIGQAYFYTVIFNESRKPYFAASRAFPDENERRSYASLIAKQAMEDEKKQQINQWLTEE